jgi:hypothetical protein
VLLFLMASALDIESGLAVSYFISAFWLCHSVFSWIPSFVWSGSYCCCLIYFFSSGYLKIILLSLVFIFIFSFTIMCFWILCFVFPWICMLMSFWALSFQILLLSHSLFSLLGFKVHICWFFFIMACLALFLYTCACLIFFSSAFIFFF